MYRPLLSLHPWRFSCSVNPFVSNLVLVILLVVLKYSIQRNRSVLPQRVSSNGSLRNRSAMAKAIFRMFRERSDLEMDIRRSLNLLRGDFGTRRIGTIGCFKGIYTTRTKPLRAYLQDAIYMGLSYGSISEIRIEGHGATNRDDYKDQARLSFPSIRDFGNLSKSEVYIWTSDHGRWIDSEHILMAPNRRFPHSLEISSYLNKSTVIGTDWITVIEHIRSMSSLRAKNEGEKDRGRRKSWEK
ncbi:hypothetical protein Bca52824_082525 [Brassica carinata]|uniref:Uncharacterized protein n=1 Tax=Brassica carinata TaxID=52824 RepID=A0A8X7TSN8_BRACI|nr:hypothetical protein Bca52824_082525 [Brassica carinata]